MATPKRPFISKSILALLAAQVLCIPVIGYGIHVYNQRTAVENANAAFVKTQQQNIQSSNELIEPIKGSVRAAAALGAANPDFFRKQESYTYLDQILNSNKVLDAVYIGFADGSMKQSLKLGTVAKIRDKESPKGAAMAHRWLDRTNPDTQQGVIDVFRFTDATGAAMPDELVFPGTYDPRPRPWFTNAQAAGNRLTVTDPYVFSTKGLIGLTVEMPFMQPDGSLVGVFAIDLTMDNLANLLAKNPVSANAVSLIVDDQKRIIAHSDQKQSTRMENASLVQNTINDIPSKLPATALATAPADSAKPFSLNMGGTKYMASITNLSSFDKSWRLLTLAPQSDFAGNLIEVEKMFFGAGAGLILLEILVVFAMGFMGRRGVQPARA